MFYPVSGGDFSLLQQDREMGPPHRLPTDAANGKMLEKPRDTKTTLFCYHYQPGLRVPIHMRNSLFDHQKINLREMLSR